MNSHTKATLTDGGKTVCRFSLPLTNIPFPAQHSGNVADLASHHCVRLVVKVQGEIMIDPLAVITILRKENLHAITVLVVQEKWRELTRSPRGYFKHCIGKFLISHPVPLVKTLEKPQNPLSDSNAGSKVVKMSISLCKC